MEYMQISITTVYVDILYNYSGHSKILVQFLSEVSLFQLISTVGVKKTSMRAWGISRSHSEQSLLSVQL
jgi:hypothetical protein